jgi:hypothetical protein
MLTEIEMEDVNLPVDRVYRLLLEYFNRERIKVTHCSEPSYIEVRIGSWNPMRLGGNAAGKIKISIFPKNKRSQIRFSADFIKYRVITSIDITLFVFVFELVLFGVSQIIMAIASSIITLILVAYFSQKDAEYTKIVFIDEVTDFLEGHAKILPKPTERTPTAFMKKCVKCGIEIPIASEECPSCGSKQP